MEAEDKDASSQPESGTKKLDTSASGEKAGAGTGGKSSGESAENGGAVEDRTEGNRPNTEKSAEDRSRNEMNGAPSAAANDASVERKKPSETPPPRRQSTSARAMSTPPLRNPSSPSHKRAMSLPPPRSSPSKKSPKTPLASISGKRESFLDTNPVAWKRTRSASPAYSMVGRRKPEPLSSRDAPGPGTYTVSDPWATSGKHGATLRVSGRLSSSPGNFTRDVMTDAPGPGAYGRVDIVSKRIPTAKLRPRTTSFKVSSFDSPGPAAYEVDKSTLTKAGVTMRRSGRKAYMSGTKVESSPGPGAYDVKAPQFRSKMGFISAAPTRRASTRTESPGPAAYTPYGAAYGSIGSDPRKGASFGRCSRRK